MSTTKWEDLDNSIIKNDLCDFPTIEEIKANNALRKLCYLRDAYNGEPLADWCDWSDRKKLKYRIEYYDGILSKQNYTFTQRVLAFKTEELRDKFLENFEDLILTAKPLL